MTTQEDSDEEVGLLVGGDKTFSVAQLSELLGVRPQVINLWVKNGCPVLSEKPRKMDLDAVMAWKAAGEKTKVTTSKERKAKKAEGSLAGTEEETAESKALEKLQMTADERNLFAWNRGNGRGWALAKPLDAKQPVVDDYIDIVNHAGKVVPTAGARLLQEAREGTLYVIDVDMAIAFLLGQLKGVVDEGNENVNLAEAVNSMSDALAHVTTWKHSISG
jgi:hypothetical protein